MNDERELLGNVHFYKVIIILIALIAICRRFQRLAFFLPFFYNCDKRKKRATDWDKTSFSFLGEEEMSDESYLVAQMKLVLLWLKSRREYFADSLCLQKCLPLRDGCIWSMLRTENLSSNKQSEWKQKRISCSGLPWKQQLANLVSHRNLIFFDQQEVKSNQVHCWGWDMSTAS